VLEGMSGNRAIGVDDLVLEVAKSFSCFFL